MDYKKTVNLPKTDFRMKANLLQREPVIRQQWEEQDLYGQVRAARAGKPKFVLHDGPPYPTGELHIGTGLNKILKDFVVRFHTMLGHDSPYVPGWDCHGLPIEHRVMQELGDKAKDLDKTEIRSLCKAYAEKFVDIQRGQFKALGVQGDWDRPYLTLQPSYEGGIIEVFGKLVDKGYVYRGTKPVHWCMTCETALAEAELEYSDEESPSIFVNFELCESLRDVFPGVGRERQFVLIWTTTPWTLPANMAIALHPDATYAACRYTNPKTGKVETTVLAQQLANPVLSLLGVSEFETLGTIKGKELAGRQYKHAFIDRVCPIVLADYVTLEDGTGCVHTAPGHGQEDYVTGIKYDIEILSPVDARGYFTEDAQQFAGQHIREGDKTIPETLEELGQLLRMEMFSHSYPHCWRCKRPVIFRSTPQWFVAVDHEGLRQAALEAIQEVEWVPPWGEIRINNMIQERPDWCISRQRSWGVPIPAVYCTECGDALLTKETLDAVQAVFEREGADSWFRNPASHFLPQGTTCPSCGSADKFECESDIFDVWFESGSSHNSVCRRHPELAFPADMYLEGSDQHRGWFQLSLLPSLAAHGCAPFKTVLTHGFVMDDKGEKMSKSLGNFISVEDALKRFGSDMIRLWTSSTDYRNDMNVSFDLIQRMADPYRRVRNTFRYLLGNLADFDPARHSVPYNEMAEFDRWALHKNEQVITQTTEAYATYQFHRVYQILQNFCTVEMSSFYFDIRKDRVYCDGADDLKRRSAQTVMHRVLLTLAKLCAPITVHTAEEVWSHIQAEGLAGDDADLPSVHLALWPQAKKEWIDEDLDSNWRRIIAVRTEVAREIEKLRAAKTVGSSLEVSVELYVENERLLSLLKEHEADLPAIFIVSEVKLDSGSHPDAVQAVEVEGLQVCVRRSTYPKCERCWNQRPSVGDCAEHATLCDRCVAVVKTLA